MLKIIVAAASIKEMRYVCIHVIKNLGIGFYVCMLKLRRDKNVWDELNLISVFR